MILSRSLAPYPCHQCVTQKNKIMIMMVPLSTEPRPSDQWPKRERVFRDLCDEYPKKFAAYIRLGWHHNWKHNPRVRKHVCIELLDGINSNTNPWRFSRNLKPNKFVVGGFPPVLKSTANIWNTPISFEIAQLPPISFHNIWTTPHYHTMFLTRYLYEYLSKRLDPGRILKPRIFYFF